MFHGMVSARHPLRMTALEPLERAIKTTTLYKEDA